MKTRLLALALLVAGVAAGHAAAPAVNKASITTHVATRSIGYFDPGESVVMTALVKPNAKTSAIIHTLKFRPRVDGITVSIAWHLGTSTSPVRLIGVNVDLLNENGELVASDVFAGTLAGLALSKIEINGLVPAQTYRLVLTGTRASSAAYSLVVEEKPAP